MGAGFVFLYNHGFSEGHIHTSKDPNSRFEYMHRKSGAKIVVKGVCNNAYSNHCSNIDLIDWNASPEYKNYLDNKVLKNLKFSINLVNPIKKAKWIDQVLDFVEQRLDYYFLIKNDNH